MGSIYMKIFLEIRMKIRGNEAKWVLPIQTMGCSKQDISPGMESGPKIGAFYKPVIHKR